MGFGESVMAMKLLPILTIFVCSPSSQIFPRTPKLHLRSSVTGTIDGKFDHGFLVTVNLGSNQLKGVLYHIPNAFHEYQLVWLNPDNNYKLVWDHGMCADTSRGAAVRDLIARALKGPLAPTQQEELVENNPLIAVEVLTKLINSAEIAVYVSLPTNTPVDLQHPVNLMEAIDNQRRSLKF
ncbi:hypothetical protein K2173_018414 [Erythroxylum novogranatense]|uniref:CCR4-NOT transcription complex subunit 11 n=1 Tax=Erythroxylum novogranatense TaxID=1862640 RepID=A0AAV8UA73_9ROSI|nr:hypothetical protein K2173_018414 [Erythroxylum novogranatense]